eukprot:13819064-Ditylum_brightwellii.AAC.1
METKLNCHSLQQTGQTKTTTRKMVTHKRQTMELEMLTNHTVLQVQQELGSTQRSHHLTSSNLCLPLIPRSRTPTGHNTSTRRTSWQL